MRVRYESSIFSSSITLIALSDYLSCMKRWRPHCQHLRKELLWTQCKLNMQWVFVQNRWVFCAYVWEQTSARLPKGISRLGLLDILRRSAHFASWPVVHNRESVVCSAVDGLLSAPFEYLFAYFFLAPNTFIEFVHLQIEHSMTVKEYEIPS